MPVADPTTYDGPVRVAYLNSPRNPSGEITSADDLRRAVEWARANDVLLVSDECYIEVTWSGQPRTILAHGVDGVVAVHSLSKRSNLAGVRAGFYAGDPELVGYLMASRPFGKALLLDVGLGHYDENIAIEGLDRDAIDVNLHWFMTSHFELVLQNRLEGIGIGASTGGPTSGWSLLHGHYRL